MNNKPGLNQKLSQYLIEIDVVTPLVLEGNEIPLKSSFEIGIRIRDCN